MIDQRGPTDALVLFGATGDLARQKLYRAIYGGGHEPVVAPKQ